MGREVDGVDHPSEVEGSRALPRSSGHRSDDNHLQGRPPRRHSQDRAISSTFPFAWPGVTRLGPPWSGRTRVVPDEQEPVLSEQLEPTERRGARRCRAGETHPVDLGGSPRSRPPGPKLATPARRSGKSPLGRSIPGCLPPAAERLRARSCHSRRAVDHHHLLIAEATSGS